MLRLSGIGRALLLVLGLCPLPSLIAFAEGANPVASPSPSDEQLEQLVGKLGADAFDIREAASRELATLGKRAVRALQGGLKHADMEVYRRCAELLQRANRSDLETALDGFLENRDEKQLLRVPAWPKFQKIVGDSPSARNLFVIMCTSDGALIDASETAIDKASQLYNQRVQMIQQRMNQPQMWVDGRQPEFATNGELAALLYVGREGKIRVDQNLLYMVNNLLHQQNHQQWIRSDATARKLLAGYIESRSDINLSHSHLYLVQQLEVKECVDWVAKMAETKNPQVHIRATALGTLGKIGGREVLPRLEALFSDTTELGKFQQPGLGWVHTQVGDVALAMSVLASGQDIVSYGYPWLNQNAINLQQNPQMPYQAAMQLGFADANARTVAFQRYKDWKAKQPKPEPKPEPKK